MASPTDNDNLIRFPAWDDLGFDSFMTRTPQDGPYSDTPPLQSTPTTQLSENDVAALFGDETLPASVFRAGDIIARYLSIGNQSFSHNITFDASASDSLYWLAGILKLASGRNVNINTGNLQKVFQNTAEYPTDAGATKLLAHMNETSGTTVADSSSNSNNGTASGAAASSTQSRFGGYSRFFNGSSDYIMFPYATAYNLTGNLQIDISIFPTSITGTHEMLSKSDNSNNENLTFRIYNGYIEFVYTSAPGVYHSYRTATASVLVNTMQDIRFTYTFGTPSSAHIYINNVEIPGNWVVGTGAAAISLTNQPIYVGRFGGVAGNWFQGYIDELRIKNSIDTLPTINPYYIYFDNSPTLKTTTNYANAVGDKKKIMAIWTPKRVYGGSSVIVMSSSGTIIDGDSIKTGRISSNDGLTYFDLNKRQIVLNDGSNDRMIIGYLPGGF